MLTNKIAIEFINLGRIGYQAAWDYQEKLFGENLKNKAAGLPTRNYLIFCEHDHVYTLGKSGSENNLLVNNKQLQDHGVTFFKTNRGGDITYHGPGQLVGYPILDLEHFGLGVKSYIEKLEKSIILALSSYGLTGEQLPGATGVWLDADMPGKTRKICAIGVKASRHITMHGFAFNVNTDLKFFDMINPCGFTDKAVTSLKKELGKMQDFGKAAEIVKVGLSEVFGFNPYNTKTTARNI
jgi:lipoyl(octanoyl) transferase